jgi:hypothetical protein
MKFTFVRGNNPAFNQSLAWYLKIAQSDFATIVAASDAVKMTRCMTTGIDPHIFTEDGNPIGEESYKELMWFLYHPVILCAKFISSAAALLEKHGEVLMNMRGGLQPFKGFKVIETKQSEKLMFPEDYPDGSDTIRLYRWPQGKHVYPSSYRGMLLPEKFNSVEEAERVIREHYPNIKIRVDMLKSQPFVYRTEGD